MNKWLGLLSFIILFNLVVGQKTDSDFIFLDYKPNATFHLPKIKINGKISDETISRSLNSIITNLNDNNVGLSLNYVQESPGGFHYSFSQTYRGHKIYQSEIKATVDRNQTLRAVIDNSFLTKDWQLSPTSSNEEVIFFNYVTSAPEWCFINVNEHDEEVVTSRDGDILYKRTLRTYKAVPDSTVAGKIFRPDPITTAKTTYQGNFKDNNNSNNADLEAQLQTVNFKTNFDGITFNLENQHIKIVDFDASVTLPVVSTTPQFFYNRSETGFEDVNAFYHLQNYQQHVKSLGFNLADGTVWADTHADGVGDNSYFTPNNLPKRLYFGTGGVDDAEDADVVTHEYGHFLSDETAPGSNVGNERRSLDEAFGDYIAASYSKSTSSYKSDWVYSWDGHNEFWNGRIVNSSKKYPIDLSTSIYRNGEMWASALMNIHDEIGRLATDSLIYQNHYAYAANMAMDDAAYLMIEADTMLNNGKYYCPIYRHLLAQGFLPFYTNNPCGISSNDDIKENFNVFFYASPQQFAVQLENNISAVIKLYNLNGQLLETIFPSSSLTTYNNTRLANGVYLVQVESKQLTSSTFKWCKLD